MRHQLLLAFAVTILLRWMHCVGSLCTGHECSSNESSITSSFDPCAPGYEGNPCRCVAHEYKGLHRCDDKRAVVVPGYWVGECGNGTLCTGSCPFGFCSYNGSTSYRLPGTMSELDEYICGDTRTGVLCGECQPGYSASYHSHSYTCAANDGCKFGWLLYIVSELLPLTVVFIVVITFNINFTSSVINGFILFAQLQDSLGIYGGGFSHSPLSNNFYSEIYLIVYRSFNLDFFSIEALSFCLWEGATVLDVVAFKYVTIAIGLALMFICVFIVNSTKTKKCFSCLKPTTLKSTLIHGLTAFFVMCYSQCARVSFHILEPMIITTKYDAYVRTVVFRSGQLKFFDSTHLAYALPAIFSVSAILLLPPLVLIMYPLLGKCLACCNLSESKFANYVSRIVPIQLLDSFQSSFKNDFRFFAGLYFFYRLVPLLVFSFTYYRGNFYNTIAILFICILAIHAVVQPYRNRRHNIIDILLFANLAIINASALVNYQNTEQGLNHPLLTLLLQPILIYLPLVCLLLICLVKVLKAVLKFCKRKCWLRRGNFMVLNDTSNLPPLREE